LQVTIIYQDLGKGGAIQGVLLTASAWLVDQATVHPELTTEV
jgi:hypothetical protein